MSKTSAKLGTLLFASLMLAACVGGTVVQNGEGAPVPQTDIGAKLERDVTFATRTCFQALASKAPGISIDPSTGFLPNPIQRMSFRNSRLPSPAVSIIYDPARLRAKDNVCLIRTIGGGNQTHLKTIDEAIAALGYRSVLVPGYAGKLQQQYIKGTTVIRSFKRRTSSTYGVGLSITFASER